jgi:protoporphyrinogen IX oxidase
MIVWVKAVHIVALTVWCAGLLVLPGLYAHRSRLRSRDAVHELHRFTRAVYINATSPAAFVAIAAGTALMFLRDVFSVWMALKLLAVGALVAIHVREGYLILYLFDPGHRYARWQQLLGTVATLGAIVAILWLVLAKPGFSLDDLPEWLRKPGGLQSLLDTMRPMP